MKLKEKWAYIESLENKEDITQQDLSEIKLLKNDKNSEIRILLAQTFVCLPVDIAEPILLSMIDDEDKLVRVNVCDSLCIGKSHDTIQRLQQKTVKDSYLVRGYAILSLADIAKNNPVFCDEILSFLTRAYRMERSGWVKDSYYYAFCLLGKKDYITHLCAELKHRFYQRRCAAANLIGDLIQEGCIRNMERVRMVLTECYEQESSGAVRAAIQNALGIQGGEQNV